MAEQIYCAGPTQVYIAAEATSPSFSLLGYCDNDNPPQVSYDRRHVIVEAANTGLEPAEIIFAGMVATLSMVLVNWDRALLSQILVSPGGSNIGDAGVIGTRYIVTGGDSNYKRLRLDDLIGNDRHDFHRCVLDGPSVRVFPHGLDAQRLGLDFLCWREGDNNTLGVGSTGTKKIFTKGTIS